MSEAASIFCVTLYLALYTAVGVGAWLSFRRTRKGAFLFLGAVLIIWPWFDCVTDELLGHFVRQLMLGQTPRLFPFSLMVPYDVETTSLRKGLTPGTFRAWYGYGKQILFALLLAVSFWWMARSLKHARGAGLDLSDVAADRR